MYLFDVAALGASFASVSRGLSGPASVVWVILTGFLLGCAVSVKFTALGIVATVAFHQAAVLLIATPGPLVARLRTVRAYRRRHNHTILRHHLHHMSTPTLLSFSFASGRLEGLADGHGRCRPVLLALDSACSGAPTRLGVSR